MKSRRLTTRLPAPSLWPRLLQRTPRRLNQPILQPTTCLWQQRARRQQQQLLLRPLQHLWLRQCSFIPSTPLFRPSRFLLARPTLLSSSTLTTPEPSTQVTRSASTSATETSSGLGSRLTSSPRFYHPVKTPAITLTVSTNLLRSQYTQNFKNCFPTTSCGHRGLNSS